MTRRSLFGLWLLAALAGLGGACHDPNPTFVFDAAPADGAKPGDAGAGGTGGTDGGITDGGGQ